MRATSKRGALPFLCAQTDAASSRRCTWCPFFLEVNVLHKLRPLSLSAFTVLLAVSACGAPGSMTAGPELEPAAVKAVNPGDPTTNTALVALRQVTAKYQRFEDATAAGYSTKVTPCWAHHSAGAMGYHYGKMELFDGKAELLEPEVLMYEPNEGGHLKLVGMEYIVPIDAWKAAGHSTDDPNDRPKLLGQTFTQHSTLPIYKLHIWLWRDNPQGTFADWNPKVSCAAASDTETF